MIRVKQRIVCFVRARTLSVSRIALASRAPRVALSTRISRHQKSNFFSSVSLALSTIEFSIDIVVVGGKYESSLSTAINIIICKRHSCICFEAVVLLSLSLSLALKKKQKSRHKSSLRRRRHGSRSVGPSITPENSGAKNTTK